jgi:hypothetical protein
MKRRKRELRSEGTGFTKRTYEVFPVDEVSKIRETLDGFDTRPEAHKAAGGYIFYQLNLIEAESKQILKKAKLPNDPIIARKTTKQRGYAHDTLEVYAANQLDCCRKIRALIEDGKTIEACGKAFDLGQSVREEEIKHLTNADGPSKGGKQAARSGRSKTLPETRREEIRRVMADAPRGEKGKEKDKLVRKLGVSRRTIERIIAE